MTKQSGVKGLAQPALEGVGLEGPPEQVVARLAELAERQPRARSAVAQVLGAMPVQQAAELLARMEAGAASAERREIRRALFRLRQKGITPQTPGRAAGAAEGDQPASPAGAPVWGFLSARDAQGLCLAWLVRPRPGTGGVRRLAGLCSDREGLIEFVFDESNRRELRELRRDLERRYRVRLVEADWTVCDFILCQAYAMTPAGRLAGRDAFLGRRAEFTDLPLRTTIEHPIYDVLGHDRADAQPSVELFKEPEAEALRSVIGDVEPYVERIEQVVQSRLVVSEFLQQERLEAVLSEVARELLGSKRGLLLRRRLEDLAYYLLRDGRPQPAGWAAAAAWQLKAGIPLEQNNMLRTLIRSEVEAALGRRRRDQETRLVLTPAQAREASRTEGRRTG